jgi:hypothetical protein
MIDITSITCVLVQLSHYCLDKLASALRTRRVLDEMNLKVAAMVEDLFLWIRIPSQYVRS